MMRPKAKKVARVHSWTCPHCGSRFTSFYEAQLRQWAESHLFSHRQGKLSKRERGVRGARRGKKKKK